MAQITWTPGQILTAADLNFYASHEGGAFTTWTPAVTQSGSVTVTVAEATYARAGRLIHYTATLVVTGSGTGSNDIVLSLPVTAKSGYTTASCLGIGSIRDSSASASYYGQVYFVTTTTVKLKDTNSSALSFLGGATSSFSAGLANPDTITIHGFYEAAT